MKIIGIILLIVGNLLQFCVAIALVTVFLIAFSNSKYESKFDLDFQASPILGHEFLQILDVQQVLSQIDPGSTDFQSNIDFAIKERLSEREGHGNLIVLVSRSDQPNRIRIHLRWKRLPKDNGKSADVVIDSVEGSIQEKVEDQIVDKQAQLERALAQINDIYDRRREKLPPNIRRVVQS